MKNGDRVKFKPSYPTDEPLLGTIVGYHLCMAKKPLELIEESYVIKPDNKIIPQYKGQPEWDVLVIPVDRIFREPVNPSP